jgi:lysylphosphatidylglycerol synthetase-like protein (DUF2156 family)
MRALFSNVVAGSKAVSLLLGGGIIILAVAAAATRMSTRELTQWVTDIFGVTFVLLLGSLVLMAIYCWVRLVQGDGRTVWLEAGLQASNGITTLALTFTLLGISLGIGTLAQQDLGPDTVKAIVRDLTGQFSMAFLTTVVGLPLSAVLRTLLLVSHAWQVDACALNASQQDSSQKDASRVENSYLPDENQPAPHTPASELSTM